MELTFVLTDVKEIDADLADFLFENGFDDSTPYSSEGRCFLLLDDENPAGRLQQLAALGIRAEMFSVDQKKS